MSTPTADTLHAKPFQHIIAAEKQCCLQGAAEKREDTALEKISTGSSAVTPHIPLPSVSAIYGQDAPCSMYYPIYPYSHYPILMTEFSSRVLPAPWPSHLPPMPWPPPPYSVDIPYKMHHDKIHSYNDAFSPTSLPSEPHRHTKRRATLGTYPISVGVSSCVKLEPSQQSQRFTRSRSSDIDGQQGLVRATQCRSDSKGKDIIPVHDYSDKHDSEISSSLEQMSDDQDDQNSVAFITTPAESDPTCHPLCVCGVRWVTVLAKTHHYKNGLYHGAFYKVY